MNKFNIPIYRLKFENSFIKKFQAGVRDILKSDSISEGPFVRRFEKDFGKLVKAKYCTAVTSCTSALETALRVLDVRGKKVLMPTNTFFATSVAATNAGAEIELLDIEEDTLAIDPLDLEKRIKTKNVGAVILVHIGGIISKHFKRIQQICKKHRVPLIEDAAHAHGSMYRGSYAGSIGTIGCFSFFPTKVMTTGEGGMLTTNDKKLHKKIMSLKNFGRPIDNPGICIFEQGSNYKVTELTGLFGVLECSRVRKRIERRNILVKKYVKNLKKSDCYSPVIQDRGKCSYYKLILKTTIEREWLKKYCKKHNITLTGEVYRIPIHKQPLYVDKFKRKSFPAADNFCKNHICPPLYPELSDAEVDYICKILIQAEKEYEKSHS